ncbi:MAG TPA: hypothetical protein VFT90_04120 [Chryseosolibacter sp.]|nr:hypothetical protein [Chryseosolibacter sp.]
MSALITYFEIAAFGASLVAWPYIQKSRHLRLFPLLLFIIVVVELFLTFNKESFFFNAIVYNVQVPLQHLLYLYILYAAMEGRRARRVVLISAILFVAVALISTIFLTSGNRINTVAYCTGSVLIIGSILIKFHEMLQNPTEFNFLRNPFFYMLFAFLLFNVGTLPYFTMGNWLYYSMEGGRDVLMVFINVMSVFNFVLYTTYSIAFVWMILKKGSY